MEDSWATPLWHVGLTSWTSVEVTLSVSAENVLPITDNASELIKQPQILTSFLSIF
jgi:hypothetical protein